MKLALALGYVFALAAAHPYPSLQWDPNTISTCTEWWDNGGSDTCEYIRALFGITPEEFHIWNPSVGIDCKPWYIGQSYCILTKEKLMTSTKTTASTTTSKTTSSTYVPSPTAWKGLGCYTDEDATFPVLDTKAINADTALIINKCEDTCWKASNRTVLFAGVKQGNQCWCGSFVGGQTARNEADCNSPCTGDKAAVCGGKNRINVFEPVTTKGTSSTTSKTTSTTKRTTSTTKTTSLVTPTKTSGATKAARMLI